MNWAWIVAVFARDVDAVAAARALRTAGLRLVDVHGPYYVHEFDELLDLPASPLPGVCLGAGLLGAALKLGFELWTAVVDWPLNVGGKPFNSLPAFVPITFEVMVLFAGLATVGVFFWRAGLRLGAPPRRLPPGVTDDRFALVVQVDAGRVAATRRLLDRYGAVSIEESTEADR